MSRGRRRNDYKEPVFRSRRDLVVCAIGASALYAALGLALLDISGVGTSTPKSWGPYALQGAGGSLIWYVVTGAVMSFLQVAHAGPGKPRVREFVQRFAKALLVGVIGAAIVYVLYDPGAFGPAGERMRRTTVGTVTGSLGLVLEALLVYAGAYASGARLGPWGAARASARFFLSWRGFRLAFGVLLIMVALNVLLRFAVGERISDVTFSTVVLVGLGFAAVYVSGAVLNILRERR